jgi:hypothetical protein
MNHAGGSNRRYTLQFAAVGVSLCLALATFSFLQPMLSKRWRMMMGQIASLPQTALVLEVFQVSSGPAHMLKDDTSQCDLFLPNTCRNGERERENNLYYALLKTMHHHR